MASDRIMNGDLIRHHVTNAPISEDSVFSPISEFLQSYSIPFSKHVLMLWIVAFVTIVISLWATKSYNKIINGLQYHVGELSLALFPLKKGQYEIPSSIIELDLIHSTQNRSSRDPFSQFFGRRTRAEHKVLRSQPLSIEVLPLPDGAP